VTGASVEPMFTFSGFVLFVFAFSAIGIGIAVAVEALNEWRRK
jgi:hypothetical protein